MDDIIKRIILSFLTKWKTTRVSKDKLMEVRDEIVKKTEGKPLALPALKKMVRRIVKETTQAEKIKEAQFGTMHEGATSITHIVPITSSLSEKVFQQALIFDLKASKVNIERGLEKLSSIKNQAKKQPKLFRNMLSAEVAAIRRDLEKLATKLTEVERQFIMKSSK